jgi:hypothetical protein
MMTNRWKANVGDHIHVRTEYNVGAMKAKYIKTGVVIKSERHDSKDTFRLYTGNPQYPVSLIAYERVTGVKLRKGAA